VTTRLTPDHREVDVTTTRTWRRLGAALVAAAALAAAPAADAVPLTPNCTASGGEQLCEVWATAGSVTVGGSPIPVWRFTDSGGGTLLPLVVTQGDTVRLRVHNTLGTAVSLALPQIPDVLHGASGSRGADTTGAAAGGTQDYVFTATRPGTFLYEAGPTASGKQQVAMGLAAALVVLPTTAGQAYGSATTAYTDEDVLVLTDVDPALNTAADPAAFNLRAFHAAYHLVNGQPAVHQTVADPGARLLLRYVNAGLQNRWAGLIGLSQARIGTNGRPLANALTGVDQEQAGVVAALPAGETAETLVTMPADAGHAGFRYPLFDEGLTTSDAGDGALAYLEVAGTLSLPACPDGGAGTVPPLVHDLSTPAAGHIADLANPSAATTVFTVTGRALECRGVTGEQPADTVRYAIDAIPGGSSPTAAVDNTGAFQIALTEADVASIANGGHHYLIVQAGRGGTFGTIAATQLTVDNVAPALDLAVDPAVAGAGGSFSVTGSASDRFLGDSDVTSMAWSIDGGTATTVTVDPAISVGVDINVPASSLAAGAHTIAVTATDAFGNVSQATNLSVTYDPDAPALSGVVLEQRLPASTQYPFGGPLTTFNNGTLTFDPNMWAIRVRGTATDALSKIAAMRGSFDDAICTTTPAGEPAISGARLDPKDGAWSATTEAGFAYVPLSELNRWLPAAGQPAVVKAFHVRARDAAGNWSACADGTVTLDRTNPAITVPLQLSITGAGEMALARSTRPRTMLVVRLSARDAGGLSVAEFFDGNDPGRGKGTILKPADGSLGTADGLVGGMSIARMTPGMHQIHARVRDRAGNWSPVVTGSIRIAFPTVSADGFESGRLDRWHRTGSSRVTVTRSAALNGRYGLRVRTSRRPAYVTDFTPRRLKSYRASFSLATGRSTTGGWQTVFAAVDQRGRSALAVQRRTGAGGQVVRIVALRHGRAVGSSQVLLTGGRHSIAIAWFGGRDGEAGLWIDGRPAAHITALANTGEMIESARLGQITRGTSRTRGVLLIDQFASTT
jgi:FtsP/CotA-like multicopper oxidase with cupredoxin domain